VLEFAKSTDVVNEDCSLVTLLAHCNVLFIRTHSNRADAVSFLAAVNELLSLFDGIVQNDAVASNVAHYRVFYEGNVEANIGLNSVDESEMGWE
jgi:hypothetical protein